MDSGSKFAAILEVLRSDDVRAERLKAAIETFQSEALLASDADLRAAIDKMLDKAEDLRKSGSLHAAWGSLAVARRLELFTMPRRALHNRALALAAEADQKLHDWRKTAAKSVLVDQAKAAPPGLDDLAEDDLRARAWYVSYLLDGESENIYLKQALTSESAQFLCRILMILVAAAILVLTPTVLFPPLPEKSTSLLMLPYAALFGAMGACFSGLRSLLSPAKGAVPEVRLASFFTTLRPVIGATAAIVVFFAESAGIINLSRGVRAGILAESFVAGFSEALVVRVLGAFDTPEKK
jgi:hypothetical protein